MPACAHFREFMAAQFELVKEHIDEHLWCRHIVDRNLGVLDFIKEYGWIFREVYCRYACPDKNICEVSLKLANKEGGVSLDIQKAIMEKIDELEDKVKKANKKIEKQEDIIKYLSESYNSDYNVDLERGK